MATREWIESAAIPDRKKPNVGGRETTGHHILAGTTDHHLKKERERWERYQTLAARYVIKHARDRADRDLLIDVLGLAAGDARPTTAEEVA